MKRKLALAIFVILWVFVTLGSTRAVARFLFEAAEKSSTPQLVEERYQELIDEGRSPDNAALNATGDPIWALIFTVFYFFMVAGVGPFVWDWGAKKFLPPVDDYCGG